MLENEPFEKLLVPYKPLPKRNHYPPILVFGFAIPYHVAEFRRAALKYNLGDSEELNNPKKSSSLRELITSHINERCGLPPGQGIICQHIDSKQGDLVLEIATNYRARVPGDKLDEVLRGIREVLSLPDHTQPKWYLEPGIFEKDPDEYRLPGESYISPTMWGAR
jgi:hypothetical protein